MISKIPRFLQQLFKKNVEFRQNTKEKVIFLTFDDGPVPEVTNKVLEILKRYNAKATFFCVGDNIRKYPGCYQSLLEEGHSVGNHTMYHSNGLRTTFEDYKNSVEECEALCETNLFRPPYGRVTKKQLRYVKSKGYRIILWTVISFDYNKKYSPTLCLKNSLKLKAGDIILFHDNPKAERNMLYCLENVLSFYSKKGFRFERIA
ncbi:MAG: polysaccharide deacetylase family protein [Bacteroidales bacterium]|nr:polysaccharide deacetylase family protein [Bacteroidales bacterium]